MISQKVYWLQDDLKNKYNIINIQFSKLKNSWSASNINN